MDIQYKQMECIAGLYQRLEDELSRKIFWARLKYDITYCIDDMLQLCNLTGMYSEEQFKIQMTWRENFERLQRGNKKIILYGAGTCGRHLGNMILQDNSDFYGYCDRNAQQFHDGVLGKPVISPQNLFDNPDEFYVVITTMDHSVEVYHFLLDNGFPCDHILPFFNRLGKAYSDLNANIYFEFPELYPKNKAFIDGGCFDCGTSLQFEKWSKGNYSKIFAFEPDSQNFQKCQAAHKHFGIKRMELFQAGLSDKTGTVIFAASNSPSSHISNEDADKQSMIANIRDNEKLQTIKTFSLSEVTKNDPVGFIKLDIEGAELSALYGAEKILLRDKPFLAICVYHRRGDVLAIMDYLHSIIPNYRFWLRQYLPYGLDTVLYASI